MATLTGYIPKRTSLSHRTFFSEIRAIVAVTHREWLHFIRYPSWVVGLIIWPFIFPMAYILSARALAGPDGSGLALFLDVAGTDNFLGYIIVGTTVWMWQNIVLWDVGLALRKEQWRGTLETNWLTPTRRFSLLVGVTPVQLLTMGLFILVSLLEFGLFFGLRLNGNPLLMLLMMAAAIPSIYGLGIAFASLVIAAKEANAFVFLVRGMVMIFCGITYPVSLLPGWMQGIANWLPQTYIIHGVRSAALAGADFQALLPDLVPLIFFGTFWLAVGYVLFNWMERRARRTGAISQY
jgi:ABC-2 type transport system permease protein